MDNISNLVGNSSIASFLYYSGAIIIAVFFGGWFLNGRLKKLWVENNYELENRVNKVENRLSIVESEAITTAVYERDIKAVRDLVTEIRSDVREGFSTMAARVDTLFAFKSKD